MSVRSIISIIVLIGLLAISSGCKKTCSNVTCRTYGYNSTAGFITGEVCNNGTCYCPNGYEGDSCQLLSYKKYVLPTNSWLVSDACSGTSSYPVNIYTNYPTSGVNVLLINGLLGGGAQVEADIVSNASHQGINLSIPSQNTPSGLINSGQGFYQSAGVGSQGKITITLDYTSNSTGIETNCTLILYQQ